MEFPNRTAALVPLLVLCMGTGQAQSVFSTAGKQIQYKVEAQATAGGDHSPLWLNANRYGLSSVKGSNGYLRAAAVRPTEADSGRKWRLGYAVDLAAAYDFTSSVVVQQLYAELQYKKVRLSVGSKERPAMFKHPELSSGSMTLGTNARPIPEARIEIPDYLSLTGKSNWVAIKGHFGYGLLTDGKWREDYASPTSQYTKGIYYHSKAGYLRVGNEEKFPLVFEGGLEWAATFGGTLYNYKDSPTGKLDMNVGAKDFWDAIWGGGSDATDDVYANASGNILGSWLFSLSYKGKDWKIRAYYDHFFEDHSMMFFQYGWLDGLVGVELTLPKNPAVTTFVYEYIGTKYQSGPLYHDATDAIPDQSSAIDNYYNHGLFQGWQHWGQAIGNPLFTSPLYNGTTDLSFVGNRFKAHHFGLAGTPLPGLNYRLLYTYMANWGTYYYPYDEVKYDNSFLCELRYDFTGVKRLSGKGWSLGLAFSLDRGRQIGDNTGFQLTIAKKGWLTK